MINTPFINCSFRACAVLYSYSNFSTDYVNIFMYAHVCYIKYLFQIILNILWLSFDIRAELHQMPMPHLAHRNLVNSRMSNLICHKQTKCVQESQHSVAEWRLEKVESGEWTWGNCLQINKIQLEKCESCLCTYHTKCRCCQTEGHSCSTHTHTHTQSVATIVTTSTKMNDILRTFCILHA